MPGHFTQFPTEAWTDKRLTPTDILVLGIIAAHSNEKRGGWPKRSTVAEALDINARSVSRCINRLKSFGYVTAVRQFRANGGQRENLYFVEFKTNRADVDPLDIVDGDEDETQPAAPPMTAGSSPPLTLAQSGEPLTATVKANEQNNNENPPSPHGGDDLEKAFDQIWEAWPEHGRKHSPGRAMCLRAFEKAAQGIPLPSMISAVKAFVAQLNPKYAPSLSKWLREGKAEAWLPKTTAIAVPGGARAFSTALPVAPSEDARKCLGALQERFGETKVAAWFSDAIWDGKVIRLKSAYHAQRVTVDFGGVLREHGFTAVEGSAAA